MADTNQNGARIVLLTATQARDYAFDVQFDGAGFDALHVDEGAPLGAGSGPDPVQLLLAGVANCLSASLLFALRKYKNAPSAALVTTASATVGRNDAGRVRVLAIEANLKLPDAVATYASHERLLAQFEQFCTVTESVRGGIPVTVRVTDASGAVVHENSAGA